MILVDVIVQFFQTDVVTVASIIVGILGTLFGWLGLRRSKKRLHYAVQGNAIVIKHDKMQATGLTLSDKQGQEVRGSVGVLDIEFQNHGPLPIEKEDINEPLRILLPDASRILDASITHQTVRGDPGFNVVLFANDQGDCKAEYAKIFTPDNLEESGVSKNVKNPHAKSVGIKWRSFHEGAKVRVSILYETVSTLYIAEGFESSRFKLLVHGPSFSEKNLVSETYRHDVLPLMGTFLRMIMIGLIIVSLLLWIGIQQAT